MVHTPLFHATSDADNVHVNSGPSPAAAAAPTPSEAGADQEGNQRRTTAAVGDIIELCGPIEQCKGMLMLVYRIDADQAFDVLRWVSHQTDVKVGVLAARLTAEFRALNYGNTLPPRAAFDRIIAAWVRRS